MAKKDKKLGVIKGDKAVTEKQETPMTPNQDKKPPRIYKYGDLVFQCSCGYGKVLDRGVPGNQGSQILLSPQEGSQIALGCEKCKALLTIKFIESSKEDIARYEQEATEKLKVEENEKYAKDLKLIKEENESVLKEGETEQVAMGISDSDKQPVESNS
jgi:hypothetical protein